LIELSGIVVAHKRYLVLTNGIDGAAGARQSDCAVWDDVPVQRCVQTKVARD